VYVAGAYQRRGIGRGLYASLFAVLAAQGYVNAYAGITLPNAASVALHEGLGFAPLGIYRHVGYKFGGWHDVGWWQRALTSHRESPHEPLDLAAVQARSDWDALLGGGQPVARGQTGGRGGPSPGLAVDIREFRPGNEQAVVSLWERCGLTRPWNDPQKEIARKLAVQPNLFLVGLVSGQVVATVMAGYDGHRGWIHSLAVVPEARREGLGRAIVREAERRLAAAGCPKVNLQIRGENAGVVAFYRARGYVEEDRVSMGRRLGPFRRTPARPTS
jgi:L-amino acid N-acyltransferase YncA